MRVPFETADIWTHTCDADEYVAFLRRLFARITRPPIVAPATTSPRGQTAAAAAYLPLRDVRSFGTHERPRKASTTTTTNLLLLPARGAMSIGAPPPLPPAAAAAPPKTREDEVPGGTAVASRASRVIKIVTSEKPPTRPVDAGPRHSAQREVERARKQLGLADGDDVPIEHLPDEARERERAQISTYIHTYVHRTSRRRTWLRKREPQSLWRHHYHSTPHPRRADPDDVAIDVSMLWRRRGGEVVTKR